MQRSKTENLVLFTFLQICQNVHTPPNKNDSHLGKILLCFFVLDCVCCPWCSHFTTAMFIVVYWPFLPCFLHLKQSNTGSVLSCHVVAVVFAVSFAKHCCNWLLWLLKIVATCCQVFVVSASLVAADGQDLRLCLFPPCYHSCFFAIIKLMTVWLFSCLTI